MVKAIIFDLDNCLSPAEEIGAELLEPGFEVIRRANQGTLSEEAIAAALADCWRCPLDHVAAKHKFSDPMLAAAWKAFAGLRVEKRMRGYGDLEVLPELPVRRFLVTSGFRRLQESKVQALGIAGWFEQIRIDAIDEPGRKGKQGLFELILRDHGLSRTEVWVVGGQRRCRVGRGEPVGNRHRPNPSTGSAPCCQRHACGLRFARTPSPAPAREPSVLSPAASKARP